MDKIQPLPGEAVAASEATPLSLEDRKTLAEIAKLKIETENLKRNRSSESARFWIPVFAPVVGSFAVVATLIFQIVQFNQNAKQARSAAQSTQFREALQAFEATAPPGAKEALAESRLKSFLDSPEFESQVRPSFVSALAGIADPSDFERLFKKLFPAITHDSLPELVQVSGTQLAILKDMLDQQTSAKKALDDAKQEYEKTAAQAGIDRIDNDLDRFNAALAIVSDAIAKVMRERSTDGTDDLSFAELFRADFHDVNFSGVDIQGAWFESCNLAGADLSRVRSFDGASWGGTQWWLAKSIRPELLASLRDGPFKFNPERHYAGPPIDEATYQARLTALSQTQDGK